MPTVEHPTLSCRQPWLTIPSNETLHVTAALCAGKTTNGGIPRPWWGVPLRGRSLLHTCTGQRTVDTGSAMPQDACRLCYLKNLPLSWCLVAVSTLEELKMNKECNLVFCMFDINFKIKFL